MEERSRVRQTNFVGEVGGIDGKSKDAFADEARKHQDCGCRKIEWQVMKDAIGFVCRAHQLIEAFRRASEHVREISDVQANPFWLTGRSGGIDDGDDVAARECIWCI